MRMWVLAGALVMASVSSSLAQDAGAGEGVFKRMCSPCHDIGPGAKVKLGPPLNGLDGRVAGSFAGYNYSEANKSSGITWHDKAFAEYIKSPMQRMPGTRMAFAGVRDDKDIGNLWAFLAQYDEQGNKR